LPTDPLPIRHRCVQKSPSSAKTSRGLGDFIAAALKAIGITPSRFALLLAHIRGSDGSIDCGCEKRRLHLNRLGRRVRRWFRRF
jgi:hypothetical protein